MINVSEVVNDPDFAQWFTVFRKSGEFGSGGFIQGEELPIPMKGPVIPSTAEELNMIAEADRVTSAMNFYTTTAMYRTRQGATSDEILWQSERYRIINVWDRSANGFYKAMATRMEGD